MGDGGVATVGMAAKLALDIERKFMLGALGGIFMEAATGSSMLDGKGVGGGGSSGVGHVTMLLMGEGGGGKVEA